MIVKWLLLISACLLISCTNEQIIEPIPELWQVSNSGKGAFEASVAVSDEGTAVAWYDDRDGNAEIYLSVYDTEFNPVAEERRLTYSLEQSYEADIVWAGENLVVAWYDVSDSGQSIVKLGLWDKELNLLWEKALTGERNGRVPELLNVNGRFFIAWIEEYDNLQGDGQWSDIRGAWVELTGDVSVAPFFIASASNTTWNLNADVNQNNMVTLVYDAAYETVASELYLTLLIQTTPITMRFSADDLIASKYPDIAYNGDFAAISWHDEREGNQEIYFNIIDLSSLTKSSNAVTDFELDDSAIRVTETEGASFGAYLTWHNDALGLAWSDNSTGNSEIYFRRFDVTGNPQENAVRLTENDSDSLIPSIEASNGHFVLAWNEAFIDGHGTSENNTRSEIYMSRQP